MKEAVSSLHNVLETRDLVLFALRMDETRIRPADILMMQEMSRQLGDSAWLKVSFILTFANLVRGVDEEHNLIDTLEYRTKRGQLLEKLARRILRKANIPKLVVENIPFLPAGFSVEQHILIGEEPWMSHLVKCVANIAGGKVGEVLQKALDGHVTLYATATSKCNYL